MHKVEITQKDGQGEIKVDGQVLYCERVTLEWGVEGNRIGLPRVTLTILPAECQVGLDEASVQATMAAILAA